MPHTFSPAANYVTRPNILVPTAEAGRPALMVAEATAELAVREPIVAPIVER